MQPTMNAERLHALSKQLRDELSKGKSPTLLASLVEHLEQMVQQPQQAQAQQAVAATRTELSEVLTGAPSNEFSPAWRQHLVELDFESVLGSGLLERVEAVMARNEITPAAAIDDLRPISQRLSSLQDKLSSLVDGLEGVGISADELEPGEFEIGVLVPRHAVDSELGQLANEFKALRRIVRPFFELSTGQRVEPKLNTIASSDFTAFLDSPAAAAACFAYVLEKVIQHYKGILEIRKLHQQLKEEHVPESITAELVAHVGVRMSEGLDRIAEDLREEFPREDTERHNELMNEVRIALNAIANRIDEGFNFEVRTAAPATPGEDDEHSPAEIEVMEYATAIRLSSGALQFMNVTGRRILELDEVDRTEDPDEPETT